MKAVILAAGEGKRMHPLTLNIPKPMLEVDGRPLLEHLLDQLPDEVDEVILVVGYLHEHVRRHFADRFGRFRIQYVHQPKKLGTAHALSLCRPLLGGERFLSLYADDLHSRDDFEEMLNHPLSVLVKEVDNPERFGVATVDEDGFVRNIIEKPEQPESNLVVTGPAVLDERVFHYPPQQHKNGEYYLAEQIGQLVKNHDVKAIVASFWLPIGYPEDLKKAEDHLKKKAVSKKTKKRRRGK